MAKRKTDSTWKVLVRRARCKRVQVVLNSQLETVDLIREENPKKRARFAAVTDQPDGWSVAGQMFGIDAETNPVADELAEKQMKQHRDELT